MNDSMYLQQRNGRMFRLSYEFDFSRKVKIHEDLRGGKNTHLVKTSRLKLVHADVMSRSANTCTKKVVKTAGIFFCSDDSWPPFESLAPFFWGTNSFMIFGGVFSFQTRPRGKKHTLSKLQGVSGCRQSFWPWWRSLLAEGVLPECWGSVWRWGMVPLGMCWENQSVSAENTWEFFKHDFSIYAVSIAGFLAGVGTSKKTVARCSCTSRTKRPGQLDLKFCVHMLVWLFDQYSSTPWRCCLRQYLWVTWFSTPLGWSMDQWFSSWVYILLMVANFLLLQSLFFSMFFLPSWWTLRFLLALILQDILGQLPMSTSHYAELRSFFCVRLSAWRNHFSVGPVELHRHRHFEGRQIEHRFAMLISEHEVARCNSWNVYSSSILGTNERRVSNRLADSVDALRWLQSTNSWEPFVCCNESLPTTRLNNKPRGRNPRLSVVWNCKSQTRKEDAVSKKSNQRSDPLNGPRSTWVFNSSIAIYWTGSVGIRSHYVPFHFWWTVKKKRQDPFLHVHVRPRKREVVSQMCPSDPKKCAHENFA